MTLEVSGLKRLQTNSRKYSFQPLSAEALRPMDLRGLSPKKFEMLFPTRANDRISTHQRVLAIFCNLRIVAEPTDL